MQTDKINSVSFQSINSSQVKGVLFSRLSKPKRYVQYQNLSRSQINKDYDISLAATKYNGLSATVYDKFGLFVMSKDESIISRLFNLNPVRFLKKVAKSADKTMSKIAE